MPNNKKTSAGAGRKVGKRRRRETDDEKPARRPPGLSNLSNIAFLRIDAAARLTASLEEAVDCAETCVLYFEQTDRSRYWSTLTLLLAMRKANLARQCAMLMASDLSRVLQGGRPLNERIAEMAKDPQGLSDLEAYVDERLNATREDPLAEIARLARPFVAEELEKLASLVVPPGGLPKNRAEWAATVRRVISTFIEKAPAHLGVQPEDLPRYCINGIEKTLLAATEVPELRDLMNAIGDPTKHAECRERAHRALQVYFLETTLDARKPDAEAIIRRVLIAYGYPKRKAHSLFEAESKREKRRAAAT